jgi:hypothetical protein
LYVKPLKAASAGATQQGGEVNLQPANFCAVRKRTGEWVDGKRHGYGVGLARTVAGHRIKLPNTYYVGNWTVRLRQHRYIYTEIGKLRIGRVGWDDTETTVRL